VIGAKATIDSNRINADQINTAVLMRIGSCNLRGTNAVIGKARNNIWEGSTPSDTAFTRTRSR
jgi:hypothetical protein